MDPDDFLVGLWHLMVDAASPRTGFGEWAEAPEVPEHKPGDVITIVRHDAAGNEVVETALVSTFKRGPLPGQAAITCWTE